MLRFIPVNLSPSLLRRLAWLNLPGALLIALLQRTPVLRVLASAGENFAGSPAASVLRSVFATSVSLGAVQALVGATQFVQSPANPVMGTVGASLQMGFTITGTPSPPASFQITSGSLPPGLAFNPAPVGGVIRSGAPTVSGTPTQAGSFTVSVQGYNGSNGSGLTNSEQYPLTFSIGEGTPSTVAPTISTQPTSQSGSVNSSLTLTLAANGTPTPTVQWQFNGAAISGATNSTLTLPSLQLGESGIYRATVVNSAGSVTTTAAIVGIVSTAKVIGSGTEVGSNIVHPNGNVFDQVLLQGAAATVTADSAQNQILRISYIDVSNDIVQVEFAGPGSLTLVLDAVSGPAVPINYNQDVQYMKGHARIVVTGATQNTHLSVFSVGRANAVNQAIFKDNVTYDGLADIGLIAIRSADGKFGSIRTANVSYVGTTGFTGIYAPGVEVLGPVFIGDINAFDTATPVIMLGAVADSRITGGDLSQNNGRAVQVSGLTQLKFTDGSTSHGMLIPAKANAGQLEENGVNVTSRLVP